ncbi:uncharacterized protein BJ171DRAFT_121883 [Polychytrium aggregatum]|uniref:uncharacterized protein n=1 Tax=Polychytrium aggregatum TaxID=110093 RepID=UPI0022FF1427|nr:uncharacterized protein BJ171DRAFT_121883 [Polychytrium aggregatum]KAI9204260.1 hypothetical protein BJ171DRAFT_121883 [Polychytrium aggregatum]
MIDPVLSSNCSNVTVRSTAPASSATFSSKGQSASTSKMVFPESPIVEHLRVLNQELQLLRKHGSPSLNQVQDYAIRTWSSNSVYDAYLSHVKQEREKVDILVEKIWAVFDEVILPLWRIDDSLMPLYEELSSIRLQLEALGHQSDLDPDVRSETLRHLQERLNQIENENKHDGRFNVPAQDNSIASVGARAIPSGQAIVASLIARCYRLSRILVLQDNSISPSLVPIQKRLEVSIASLNQILMDYQSGASVDPTDLSHFQEFVDSIDSVRQHGRFEELDGTVPEGQAALHELLDEAYELIHQCLVAQEMAESSFTADVQRISQPVIERLVGIRNLLVDHATTAASAGSVDSQGSARDYSRSVPSVKSLQESLTSLRHTYLSTDMASEIGAASQHIANLLRDALSQAGKLFGSLDPLDPALAPIHEDLVHIRTSLMALRNQRNSRWIKEGLRKADSAASDLSADPEAFKSWNESVARQAEVLESKLLEIDQSRVDGQFLSPEGVAGRGQGILISLLDECYVLSFELSRRFASDA